MIDPKLNKVPVATEDDSEAELSEAQRRERSGRPRTGLSIRDTIAGDTTLSVGSRGVDASGVESGAGAGAGLTATTPGARGESPAPNIVPGASGPGTTPRSTAAPEQRPTQRLETASGPTDDEIAAHAYKCWHERGCPDGSPEVDWYRAQEELRVQRKGSKATAVSA
jgi:hypothetical protein